MNLNQMMNGAAALAVALTLSACTAEDTVSQSDYDDLLLLSAASAVNTADAQSELNGRYLGFTGNATTGANLQTISALRSGNIYSGVLLTDGTGFSSCSSIVYFDNATNTMITQNPILNGACFAGDANASKFFKLVYLEAAAANTYFYCTIFSPQDTVDAALALEDTTDRTNPGASGCGAFAWSRIERDLD